jgi:hypothetical protein
VWVDDRVQFVPPESPVEHWANAVTVPVASSYATEATVEHDPQVPEQSE